MLAEAEKEPLRQPAKTPKNNSSPVKNNFAFPVSDHLSNDIQNLYKFDHIEPRNSRRNYKINYPLNTQNSKERSLRESPINDQIIDELSSSMKEKSRSKSWGNDTNLSLSNREYFNSPQVLRSENIIADSDSKQLEKSMSMGSQYGLNSSLKKVVSGDYMSQQRHTEQSRDFSPCLRDQW